MRETGAPLAGEMTGHIFFAHGYHGFDDAQYAAIHLIGALRVIGRSLTEIKSAMPVLLTTPEMRFQVDDTRKFALVEECLNGSRMRARGSTARTARASNTRDVLVARAEARPQAGVERLMAQVDAQLALSGVRRGA